jgi:hypothetical protein
MPFGYRRFDQHHRLANHDFTAPHRPGVLAGLRFDIHGTFFETEQACQVRPDRRLKGA